MLPLFFAAMVWPARRTLAIRAIETLIALILSKFAIVAVLSLGGSALGHSTIPGAASVLTGGTLVLLAAFTPWALLRMLPLHELASAAAGGLSQAPKQTLSTAADTAMQLADGPALLGAGGGGRRALPDGGAVEPRGRRLQPHTRGRPLRTVRSSAPGTGDPSRSMRTSPSRSTPTSPSRSRGAMSGAGGAGDQIGPPTATSRVRHQTARRARRRRTQESGADAGPARPDAGRARRQTCPGSAPDAASGSAPDRAPGPEVTVGAAGFGAGGQCSGRRSRRSGHRSARRRRRFDPALARATRLPGRACGRGRRPEADVGRRHRSSSPTIGDARGRG